MKEYTTWLSLIVVLGISSLCCFAQDDKFQEFEILTGSLPSNNHTRGLVSNGQVLMASGKGSSFCRLDSIEWTCDSIIGYGNMDLRDIEIISDSVLIAIHSGFPARILRSPNLGKSWQLTCVDSSKSAFYDAIAFINDQQGFVFGDPDSLGFVVLETSDQGLNWNRIDPNKMPKPLLNEAGYAASGTMMIASTDGVLTIGTGGGEYARILISKDQGETWGVFNSPLISGPGQGIFSLYSHSDNLHLAGGDYVDSTEANHGFALFKEGKFIEPANPPSGYRSCVCGDPNTGLLISTGRTGVDYSLDLGLNWMAVTNLTAGFYSCVFYDGRFVLTGRSGRFAIITPSR